MFGGGAYIALQLGGVDRVGDVDVILEPPQSDHLPFVLLKFCSVLLLERQARKVTIAKKTHQKNHQILPLLSCCYSLLHVPPHWDEKGRAFTCTGGLSVTHITEDL